MRTLDRYITCNFLRSVLLWFGVLIALRIVADMFVSMDEFTEGDRPLGQVFGDIFTYYSCQVLLYIKEMGGIAIVAAAAFALARMNHTNELTAMLASGVSLYRIIWPIVLLSMLLGGLIIIDQEVLIPRVAHQLVRERDDVGGHDDIDVPMLTDGTGAGWHTTWFLPTPGAELMRNPVILVRDSNRALLAPIVGREARPAKLDGEAGWRIDGAELTRVRKDAHPWPKIPNTERIFSSVNPAELIRQAEEEIGKPITAVKRIEDARYNLLIWAGELRIGSAGSDSVTLSQPRFKFTTETGQVLGIFAAEQARWVDASSGDGAWELEGGWLFYPTDLTAYEITLRRSSRWLDLMSTAQLTSLLRLKRVRDPARAELALHTRFTDPINNLIMLLLAVPFIVSRERNIKVSAGMCLLVVASFSAFIYLCRYIDLAPDIAAWLPILTFGGIAAALLQGIKT